MPEHDAFIRLRLPSGSVGRLRRQAWLRALKTERGTGSRFAETVFDAPDRRLHQAGMELRLIAGNGSSRQRLTFSAHGQQRALEMPVPGDGPDVAALLVTPAGELFAGARPPVLEPVFTREMHEILYRVGSDGAEMTLVLAESSVQAGNRQMDLDEARIDAETRHARAAYALALRLADAVPARPADAAAEESWRFAEGDLMAAKKQTPPQLDRGMTAAEALQSCARSGQRHLQDNLAVLFEEPSPQAVHQTRVAVRRLRSLIGVFAPLVETPGTKELHGELKWLLEELGPLRDTDVLLSDILAPAAAALGEAAASDLMAVVEAERAEHVARARRALDSPRAGRLPLLVGYWAEGGDWLTEDRRAAVPTLEQPAHEFAATVLAQRRRKTVKAGRSLLALSPPERHRLRIRVKKLRYAADLLLPLFPGRAGRDYAASLAEVQDRLGALNDIHVARRYLEQRAAAVSDAGAAWAAGLVAGWHVARVPNLLKKADKTWRRLRKAKVFWA